MNRDCAAMEYVFSAMRGVRVAMDSGWKSLCQSGRQYTLHEILWGEKVCKKNHAGDCSVL